MIRNGSAPEGGAIRNAGELKLVEVVLRENAATPGTTANGGAVSNSGTLVLEGTWVGLNTATGNGGGLHNTGDLTLIHGPFQRTFVHENSAAVNGGGINHVGETLSVDNSTINGNTSSGSATGGGGILAEAGEVTITMSRVVANLAAKNGGGINVRPNAIVTITDSTLRVNSANTGGAIAVDGDVTLTRSSVHDNIATGDGGGATVGALLSATNSTFSRNGAADRGGGVVVRSGGVLTLNYATVAENVAVEGGGLRVLNGGVAELQNTIVGGNTGGGDCAGAVRSSSNSLDSDSTCGLRDPGDQSNTDPLLGPLQDNGGPTLTHALLGGSPAIAAAAPTTAPAIDQRGVPCPPSAADIGAFERNLINLSVTLEWTLQESAPDFTVTILRVEIRNEGPDAAGPSFVDVELPEDADVVESSESCNAGSGGLHCVVEKLATGASAAFEALVIARFGTNVAFAAATGTGEEQDPADNTTELTTEFRGFVALRAEWNLVGWQGGSLDVVEAATSIAPQLTALFVFDSAAQAFLSYRPAVSAVLNNLLALEPGQGAWLRINDPDGATWQQSRSLLIPAVQLRSGANMVAWLGQDRIPIADAVASLGDALERVFLWDPAAQRFLSFDPSLPASLAQLNTATTLSFGTGVWLIVREDVSWSFDPH